MEFALDPAQHFLPQAPFYLALVFVLETSQKLIPESSLNLAHTSPVLPLLLCISSESFEIFKNLSSKIFSLLCKIPTFTFASFSETEVFLWNLLPLLSHLLFYVLKTALFPHLFSTSSLYQDLYSLSFLKTSSSKCVHLSHSFFLFPLTFPEFLLLSMSTNMLESFLP